MSHWVNGVCIDLFHYLKLLKNNTCESAPWTLVWDDGHWTVFASGLQSAHWMMVRLAGWITQLSHPRSGEQKNGFYMHCYISSFISACQYTQTLLHTFHEDLWSHGTTLQARTVFTIRWHRVAGDIWNWKDTVKGERVRLLAGPWKRIRLQ